MLRKQTKPPKGSEGGSPKAKPAKGKGSSPFVRERDYYIARPHVICSKKGGLGISG